MFPLCRVQELCCRLSCSCRRTPPGCSNRKCHQGGHRGTVCQCRPSPRPGWRTCWTVGTQENNWIWNLEWYWCWDNTVTWPGFGLSGIQHDKTFPQLLSSLLFNFCSPLKFDEDQLRATVCCCAISKVKLFNTSSNVQKKQIKQRKKIDTL